MDRVFFGNEPLIFQNYTLLLCFKFYFLLEYCTKVPRCMLLWQPSCRCVRYCWQHSGNSVTEGQRVLAILLQICCRVCRGYWQPSEKFLRGIDNCANSSYLSEGCQYPPILFKKVMDNLKIHLKRVSSLMKKRGVFLATSLKNLEVNQRFIF